MTVHTVSGDHYSFLEEQNVAKVADIVNSIHKETV